jgi:5-hydroxyisourate hydrolase-like protein (transthyretin family)
MTRLPSRALLALLAALTLLCVATVPPASASLQIDGEESWQAGREFSFRWQPLPPPGQPSEAVYRLYDSQGKVVRAATRELNEMLKPVPVPPQPGIYTFEAWLRNEAGERGPPSTATLRFDDAVPAAPALHPPAGWVLGGDAVTLRLGSIPSPFPLSGIRGYALSLDRGSGGSPCAGISRCATGEVDVAGDDGGAVSFGTLPEGVHFARVVAVSGSGVASAVATAELRVDATPPLVSLQSAPTGWSDGPVRLTALARDELSGMAAAGPSGPYTAIAADGGPPSRSPGDMATTWVTGSGVHEVEHFARDAAGNLAAAGAGTIRIDEDPPAVVFAAAQDPAEPERIEATVNDALSGPSPDRGWIGVRPAATGASFSSLPTRVVGERLVAHWDSDAYPAGKYEFLATGFDLAGNAGTGSSRARGGRMVLVNPLKTPTQLEAGFLGKRSGVSPVKRVRYGRGVRFGGRLLTTAGTPAAGVEVAVTEAFAAGSEPARHTTIARTQADGRFQLRLAPGPSREVVATFAGNRTLTRASSPGARLEVPTAVRLRASAAVARIGGAPVVFRGRVTRARTGATAVAGLPVELQFRFRGSSWSEFRTVETDARGRFRYAYRFSDDDSRGVRFQFRAHVKGREGWPYGPSASRPVLVTGR